MFNLGQEFPVMKKKKLILIFIHKGVSYLVARFFFKRNFQEFLAAQAP